MVGQRREEHPAPALWDDSRRCGRCGRIILRGGRVTMKSFSKPFKLDRNWNTVPERVLYISSEVKRSLNLNFSRPKYPQVFYTNGRYSAGSKIVP